MSNRGWIKLHRSVVENWVFTHDPLKGFGAWVDLLLSANHKDRKISISGTLYEVKRGQKITSILKLAARWKVGRKWVSSFLDSLEKDGMITQKRNNRFTLITISNYAAFQSQTEEVGTAEGTTAEQLMDNCGTPEGTTAAHKQECKELKNVKNEKECKEDLDQNPCRVSDETPPLIPIKDLIVWDRIGEKVNEVFEHWKRVMNKPRARMDGKRRRAITARLKDGYNQEDLMLAVDGCAKTPHNQGINRQNKPYNDIELICRNGPNVERFMSNFDNPPRIGDAKSALESEAEAIELGRNIAKIQGLNMEEYDEQHKQIRPEDVWPSVEVDRRIDGPED